MCFFSSLCSDESYVIGFVVPNQKHFLALAERYGVRGSRSELCDSKAMEELVLKGLTETPLAGVDAASEADSNLPTNRRLLLLSPAGALRNPSQDPAEPGPLDPRDGLSDGRLQAETQRAENALSERHREDVRREVTRSRWDSVQM